MADVFFEGEGMKMVKSPTGAHVMFEDSKGMSRWNLVNHSEIKVNSKSDSHDSTQIDTIYFPFVCKCAIFSSRYAMAASKPIESFTSSMPTPQFAAVARSFWESCKLGPWWPWWPDDMRLAKLSPVSDERPMFTQCFVELIALLCLQSAKVPLEAKISKIGPCPLQ